MLDLNCNPGLQFALMKKHNNFKLLFSAAFLIIVSAASIVFLWSSKVFASPRDFWTAIIQNTPASTLAFPLWKEFPELKHFSVNSKSQIEHLKLNQSDPSLISDQKLEEVPVLANLPDSVPQTASVSRKNIAPISSPKEPAVAGKPVVPAAPAVVVKPSSPDSSATVTPTTPTIPAAPSQNSAISAAEIFSLVNRARVANGLPSVKENSVLALSSYKKSQDMADRHYFSHINPEGVSDVQFATAEGYQYSAFGSNIASGEFDSAQALIDAWMNSPGHRANILANWSRELGIGVYGSYFTLFVASPN